MKVLLIDNYDSFVYNLAQALGILGVEPRVVRNDVDLTPLLAEGFAAVVVSPGPGGPGDAGMSIDAVVSFAARGVPVLGVCLGHQCIAAAFGGSVARASVGPVHGKTSEVTHDGRGVFSGIPSPFEATRYHSLAVADDLPDDLEVSARSADGIVMGLRHRTAPVEGVQFHPESVLTPYGPRLLANFVDAARAPR